LYKILEVIAHWESSKVFIALQEFLQATDTCPFPKRFVHLIAINYSDNLKIEILKLAHIRQRTLKHPVNSLSFLNFNFDFRFTLLKGLIENVLKNVLKETFIRSAFYHHEQDHCDVAAGGFAMSSKIPSTQALPKRMPAS